MEGALTSDSSQYPYVRSFAVDAVARLYDWAVSSFYKIFLEMADLGIIPGDSMVSIRTIHERSPCTSSVFGQFTTGMECQDGNAGLRISIEAPPRFGEVQCLFQARGIGDSPPTFLAPRSSLHLLKLNHQKGFS